LAIELRDLDSGHQGKGLYIAGPGTERVHDPVKEQFCIDGRAGAIIGR